MKAIKNWPTQLNVSELRSFLWSCGYHHVSEKFKFTYEIIQRPGRYV